jgi:hypothetical protein
VVVVVVVEMALGTGLVKLLLGLGNLVFCVGLLPAAPCL